MKALRLIAASSVFLLILASLPRPGLALPPTADDASLTAALHRLDLAAQHFHAAAAEFTWDNIQTQPIFDKDSQLGSAIFERKNGQLSAALHIKSDNGRPVAKEIVFSGGNLSLYEPLQKRMNIYKTGANHAEFESLLTLGFGASGQDLQKGWQIAWGGTETIETIAVTRLELTPRDPALQRSVAHVTLWLDLERGLALKQKFMSPDGNYREVAYSNLRLNPGVPGDAFHIKTANGTVIMNH